MGAKTYAGGCACGTVRFEARGEPDRVVICHCLTCRKHHGAPFHVMAVFPRESVSIEGGELGIFRSSRLGRRHFCRACGSPLFGDDEGASEIELFLGALDQPSQWIPTHEAWTPRRESWLPVFPTVVRRHERNASAAAHCTPSEQADQNA